MQQSSKGRPSLRLATFKQPANMRLGLPQGECGGSSMGLFDQFCNIDCNRKVAFYHPEAPFNSGWTFGADSCQGRCPNDALCDTFIFQ